MANTQTDAADRYAARARNRVISRGVGRGYNTDQARDGDLDSVVRGALSQQFADVFSENSLYSSAGSDFSILTPPVNLAFLMRMPNDNSILRQCIEAMVVNVEGHGWRMEYVGPEDQKDSAEALKEKTDLEFLVDNLNPELSLVEMRRRWRWDLETLGFAFAELGRTRDGLPSFLSHIPAHSMRLTAVDTEAVEVEITTMRDGKPYKAKAMRRFRRFVQVIGTKKVWFKEVGDPRNIDPSNGKVNDNLRYEDTATEVIFMRQYVVGHAYGMPRWFNNVVAIQGSRQAELTNLDYFRENAIPAMAVLVSGGYLNDDTLRNIEEHLTAARGRSSQNRILTIEALADDSVATENGSIPSPKIDLKPLIGERPKDGLFLEYDKAQTDKVRSSFRLPPIFTGHAQDYSHASAKTSYEVAEGQVFNPERQYIDDVINRYILMPFQPKFWVLKANAPRISDPEEVIKAVTAFENVGAMTPNIAIGLANEAFGMDIPVIPEEWGNAPFTLVRQFATAGTLAGFEALLNAVEEEDQNDAEQDAADANDAASVVVDENSEEAQRVRRTARRAMHDLREIFTLAQRSRYVSRTRARVHPVAPAPFPAEKQAA